MDGQNTIKDRSVFYFFSSVNFMISIRWLVDNSDTYSNIIRKCRKIFINGPYCSGKSTIFNNVVKNKRLTKMVAYHVPSIMEGIKEAEEIRNGIQNETLSEYNFYMIVVNYFDVYLNNIAKEIFFKHEDPNNIIIIFDESVFDIVDKNINTTINTKLSELSEKYNLEKETENICLINSSVYATTETILNYIVRRKKNIINFVLYNNIRSLYRRCYNKFNGRVFKDNIQESFEYYREKYNLNTDLFKYMR